MAGRWTEHRLALTGDVETLTGITVDSLGSAPEPCRVCFPGSHRHTMLPAQFRQHRLQPNRILAQDQPQLGPYKGSGAQFISGGTWMHMATRLRSSWAAFHSASLNGPTGRGGSPLRSTAMHFG